MDVDSLYNMDIDGDLTEYVANYIKWSQYGEKEPSFSIMASKLHDALMYSLNLNHEDENNRQIFVRILDYCKRLMRTVGVQSIKCKYGKWQVTTDSSDKLRNGITIDPYDFINETFDDFEILRYAVAYETSEGVQHLDTGFHPGSVNGSCGYVTTHAAMTDSMKQHIYSMHLVPALMVRGSYHENWVYSVGVLPQYVSLIKDMDELEDIIFFECSF